VYDGGLKPFFCGEDSFIFTYFCGLWIGVSLLGLGAHLKRLGEKAKDECESFYNQIRMNHLI
jgi:hypothetical protein